MIRTFLKNSLLLSDGAMGTYYSQLTGDSITRVEIANISKPDIIVKIHKEYIEAGSRLIRTNTFSANTHSLKISRCYLKEIIHKAWDLAKEAAGNKSLFIAGDIGPIPQITSNGEEICEKSIISEYLFIVDSFLDKGCTIFNFETFSSVEYLKDIIEYIRFKTENSFIIVQYAVGKSGYTRRGISLERLVSESEDLDIDLTGLNCGSGPTHLVNHIHHFKTAYANAGYPEIINNRTIFNSSPEYFADVISTILPGGIKIVGGCCGTTPAHIKALSTILGGSEINRKSCIKPEFEVMHHKSMIPGRNLILAVELDPPFKPDLKKIIDSAGKMKEIGIDIITLADSPSGRMRLNPITVASRIKREIDISVMPHICCRDRNLIALKSDILAAHTEGIRDLLIVTGDPIPLEERDEVKRVFNCNSISLMSQVDNFNKTLVSDSIFRIGGALNLSSGRLDAQVARMNRKIEAGATMFLTQPLYDNGSIDFLLNMKKSDNIKILAGILPIVTYKNARFLNNEFPGIQIPDSMILRFNNSMSRGEAEDIGVEISIEIVNRLKGFVDGFYFITPFNRTNMISEIINKAELR